MRDSDGGSESDSDSSSGPDCGGISQCSGDGKTVALTAMLLTMSKAIKVAVLMEVVDRELVAVLWELRCWRS